MFVWKNFLIYDLGTVVFQNDNSLREPCKLGFYLKAIWRILQGRVFLIYSQQDQSVLSWNKFPVGYDGIVPPFYTQEAEMG